MIKNSMTQADRLSDLILSYLLQRRYKKEEAIYKDKPKKNKQGKVTNGAFNIRLISILKNTSDVDVKKVITIEKSKKQKEQTSLSFHQEKFKKLLALLPSDKFVNDISELKSELDESILSLDKEFSAENWLSAMTQKATDISFATHVAKLTHSSSKGSSILDNTTEINHRYLTTSTLENIHVDTASSNAASLPIADILKLSVDDMSILDYVKAKDKTPFTKITDNNVLIDTWLDNLTQAYDSSQKSSYFLNKQLYFPLQKDKYHLLLPLTSSSLAHDVFLENQKYYAETATQARKQKKDSLYSGEEVRSYPNKAALHVTGSNHSNASALNGKRGGRLVLFSSMPPQWQSHQSLVNKDSVFDKSLSFYVKNEVVELRKYLILLKNKELSISKPERNIAIINKLNVIADMFFDHVTQLQMNALNDFQNKISWTVHTNLSLEQQLLFEPNRTDKEAMIAKSDKQWQKTVSNSYGFWLNKQLGNKKLVLTTIHERLWRDHFLLALQNYVVDMEVAQ